MKTDLEEQYDKIYRYCFMKVGHQQIAEDLTQETFLRFFETRNYQEIGKQLAYLYTIARNQCIDYYRKQHTIEELSLLDEDTGTELIASGTEPDQRVDLLVLQVAFNQLSKEEQEMVFLRYINDVPVSDIGKIFSLSRFAVYRRLEHCLKQLKEQLEKEELE